VRRRLGLPRRLADTTARDALCRVSIDGLRAALHRAVRAAWRRKALAPVGLPLGVVALDGKVTAVPAINDPLVQTQHPEVGLPYGLIRTVTAALVSARGRPCIDAIPIPATTNEVGFFQTAFRELLAVHGALFDLISYDAGGFSRDNADAVVATRSIRLLRADPSWSYGQGKGPSESVWPHARTFLSVESITTRDGEVIARDDRMYVTSLDPSALTPKQWLVLVRRHWGVENQCHHTLDTAFAEDTRPWIEADPQGMLAVLLLRRIALTLLALYRAVTLRSKKRRATPWKRLLQSVRDALVAATEAQLAGLRLRGLPAATR
jgi:hypothetical protein